MCRRRPFVFRGLLANTVFLSSAADYITRPLGPEVVTKRMYAATREEDAAKPYIAHFRRLARSEPVKLQRG